MARNIQFQVLRGATGSMPALADGELYFAEDTQTLWVGTPPGTAVQLTAQVEAESLAEPNLPNEDFLPGE
jgi:hypothetical protein